MKKLVGRLFWGISAVGIILGTRVVLVAIWPDMQWMGIIPSVLFGIIIWAGVYTLVEKMRTYIKRMSKSKS